MLVMAFRLGDHVWMFVSCCLVAFHKEYPVCDSFDKLSKYLLNEFLLRSRIPLRSLRMEWNVRVIVIYLSPCSCHFLLIHFFCNNMSDFFKIVVTSYPSFDCWCVFPCTLLNFFKNFTTSLFNCTCVLIVVVLKSSWNLLLYW